MAHELSKLSRRLLRAYAKVREVNEKCVTTLRSHGMSEEYFSLASELRLRQERVREILDAIRDLNATKKSKANNTEDRSCQ